MPETESGVDATNSDTHNRMVRARDRMRQVDLMNCQKLRVLQVALEESWDVARILEKNQYEEADEPELVSARKKAEGALKRKKEEEEVEAISDSCSESSSEDDN